MRAVPLECAVVSRTVATIYVRPEVPLRSSAAGRWFGLLIGAACLGVLVTAASVAPDPDRTGVGTHTRLGMAPCGLEVQTGLPCPTCGMTTSFSYFVHGNLLASFYVQPMGFVLAGLAAVSVWGGLYVGLTGRPIHWLLRLVRPGGILVGLFVLAILAWIWKIAIHLNGWDGWH